MCAELNLDQSLSLRLGQRLIERLFHSLAEGVQLLPFFVRRPVAESKQRVFDLGDDLINRLARRRL